MSPNAAASSGVPAVQPMDSTRLNNVSGPRVLDTITLWPWLIATAATARAREPAPIMPTCMSISFINVRPEVGSTPLAGAAGDNDLAAPRLLLVKSQLDGRVGVSGQCPHRRGTVGPQRADDGFVGKWVDDRQRQGRPHMSDMWDRRRPRQV